MENEKRLYKLKISLTLTCALFRAYLGLKTCFPGLSQHKFMLRLPQSPKLALKFNCGSFKKKFVEIEFQEVTEMPSFTLIIREKMVEKMRLIDALVRLLRT